MNLLTIIRSEYSGLFSLKKVIMFSLLLGVCCLLASCKTENSKLEHVNEMATVSPDSITNSENSSSEYTQEVQENVQRLIKMTLTNLFKEDLEKGFLDSASRKYLYDQVDLNGDGNMEILVGLNGSNFCGSGGCTVYLLTHQGDVITRFTVVDYPVYVAAESTYGWKNLILTSGRKDRLLQFDGEKYPSNPSVLEVFSGDLANAQKLLEWDESKFHAF